MSESITPAALEDQLCFQLYAASRAVSGAYRDGLSALGLTYPQYATMLAVWEQGGRTVTELCEALALDSGTISPLLSRLAANGWIKKVRGGVDGRAVRIFCTEAGADLEQRAAEVRTGVEAATGLSPAEFTRTRDLLQQLRTTLAKSSGAQHAA
ncbi:MAG: MarR family transcriptional regulator [Leucobacter sp.]